MEDSSNTGTQIIPFAREREAQLAIDAKLQEQGINWKQKPSIPTDPQHHFCSVIERGDIERQMHSSHVAVHDGGIKLDGRRNLARLVQVLETGPGRWVNGGRQPCEVARDDIAYVKERTISFRMMLRRQNHFFIAMDSILATLDVENLRLRPVGQMIVTREVEERSRIAVMGDLPFHVGKTMGLDKKGSEADDIGCNTRRIEEVVAVGPGKFGGFKQELVADPGSPLGMRLTNTPYWETPDVKPGDLIVFSDMARATSITIAGRTFSVFEYDHSICCVLDQAV
jgi:hypothetical protein